MAVQHTVCHECTDPQGENIQNWQKKKKIYMIDTLKTVCRLCVCAQVTHAHSDDSYTCVYMHDWVWSPLIYNVYPPNLHGTFPIGPIICTTPHTAYACCFQYIYQVYGGVQIWHHNTEYTNIYHNLHHSACAATYTLYCPPPLYRASPYVHTHVYAACSFDTHCVYVCV